MIHITDVTVTLCAVKVREIHFQRESPAVNKLGVYFRLVVHCVLQGLLV